jgi:hypothetical protein
MRPPKCLLGDGVGREIRAALDANLDSSETKFTAVGLQDHSGWIVRVELPRGLTRLVDGFKSEQQAKDWIKRDSAAWLKRVEGGKFGPS